MAWYLRKVRWMRWEDRIIDPKTPFTAISPDPLGDVSTIKKKLSLWQVDDDFANLDRVIALLAATVQAPAEFAFITFPADQVDFLGLRVTQDNGQSPDAKANVMWHFDLEVPSAEHLIRFARFLLHQGKRDRKNVEDVKRLIYVGIQKRELDPTKMSSSLLAKVRPS